MQYQPLARRGEESKVCADAGYIVYRETLLIFLIADNRSDWRLILHRKTRLLLRQKTKTTGMADGGTTNFMSDRMIQEEIGKVQL